ncbi:beta-lactamase superfamily domain-containing protein [Dunaliella salina]|uniref:Beta-lactamase superfamily domain-containing protein n=1 Tax=Dunaliella salina TaxID=3046 RepID=A0ABQ7GJK2_DUNSA|nr:beta-lactamase superfamily domain-containing protein [Dunaliella salina]|eukprot:KAF5834786.1 beta-lactamase superfamily domain-containing protein [Dunaliella salina]
MKFNASGAGVLVDPWFTGDLAFLEQDWMYQGHKRVLRTDKVKMDAIMADTDVIVITQGLDDHCHMPTLRECVPKDKPIVANPAAAERISPLGFSNVMVLDHGQSVDVADGRLQLTATVGALVGPPWSKRENGLVFREKVPGGASAYFEAHCDFDEASVSNVGQVDMVVSPISSSLVGVGPVAMPLVMGDINLVKLLKILKPKVLVPLLNAELNL